jgi:hypothetical protein
MKYTMDIFATLFWIGFVILVVSHVTMLDGAMMQHAIVSLVGTAFMFVGSKLGREFLGIR